MLALPRGGRDTTLDSLTVFSASAYLPMSVSGLTVITPRIVRPYSRPWFITVMPMIFFCIVLATTGFLMVDCVLSFVSMTAVGHVVLASISLLGAVAPARPLVDF